MDKRKKRILKELLRSRTLDTTEKIETFSKMVEQLRDVEIDVDYAKQLLQVFNSNFDSIHPMYELHNYLIHELGNEIVIEALLTLTNTIDIEWQTMMYGTLLTREKNGQFFKSIYQSFHEDLKTQIREILIGFMNKDYSDSYASEDTIKYLKDLTQKNVEYILDL